VKNAFISRAINVGRERLREVTLANLWDFDKALHALIENCPIEGMVLLADDLQTRSLAVYLEEAKQLKKLTLGPDMGLSMKQIDPIMEALSDRLEEFDCRRVNRGYIQHNGFKDLIFPKLRLLSASIEDETILNFHPLMKIATQRSPFLDSLTIRHLKSHLAATSIMFPCAHMQLTTLDITVPGICASHMQLPPSLVHLRVRSAERVSNGFWMKAGPSGLEPTIFHLPMLEELHLEVWAMIMQNAVFALGGQDGHVSSISSSRMVAKVTNDAKVNEGNDVEATTPSKLRKLSIVGAKLNYLSTSELFQHPRLRELEELYFPGLESCCDEDVKGIVESLPKLQTLDMSENHITGVGVRHIVESSPVKELIVNHCHSIGLDAIEWARSTGMKVRYQLSEGGRGGSKIRH